MKNYIVYNKNTGEVLRSGACPAVMMDIQKQNVNEEVVEGCVNDDTQYINPTTGVVLDKPLMYCSINTTEIDADGVDTCIISNIPNPTEVKIVDDDIWTVTDGEFKFTTDTPGEYVIILKSPVHLGVEYRVNAS